MAIQHPVPVQLAEMAVAMAVRVTVVVLMVVVVVGVTMVVMCVTVVVHRYSPSWVGWNGGGGCCIWELGGATSTPSSIVQSVRRPPDESMISLLRPGKTSSIVSR